MRYLEHDGKALPDDVSRLIPLTYGHFTAMQVRDRAVAGWPLHLARLAASSREMFGSAVPDAQVHALAAQALTASGLADASMRIMMVPPASGMTSSPVTPEVVVVIADPVDLAPGPALRTCSQVYERELPHVKHLATMGLTRAHRLAVAGGFDDAVFVDRDGLVLEGSIYNIAFWDGEAVVWPRAPMLTGIMMQLVQAALASLGVPQRTVPVRLADVASFRAAFFTNSQCAGQPIASLDDVVFAGDERLWSLLASLTFPASPL